MIHLKDLLNEKVEEKMGTFLIICNDSVFG